MGTGGLGAPTSPLCFSGACTQAQRSAAQHSRFVMRQQWNSLWQRALLAPPLLHNQMHIHWA